MSGRSPDGLYTLDLLPRVTWIMPLVGLLVLPLFAEGDLGRRLNMLFVELLLGFPLLLATPAALRPLYMPFRQIESSRDLLWFGAALVVAPLFLLITYPINQVLPVPEELAARTIALMRPSTLAESFLLAATLLVVTPLSEELLFRGLLRRAWLEGVGSRWLVFGPALLFAAAHMNPWQLPQLFLLGLALGLLRERSHSLGPPILLHAAVNLAAWLDVLWH
jgi:membrane protease YdiL (CAAX protease family)